MAATSSIEWTDATWNPVRGCVKISPGCANCIDPQTPVLMADWTSRRIRDVREGDLVVAFDEGTTGVGVNKVYEKATVERVWWTRKPAVRLSTDDGGSIIASTDHLFLKPPRGWFKAGNARVLQTRIRRIATAEPVEVMSDAYCGGYLAGATDGDGTMRERIGAQPYRKQQWYWRVAVSGRQTEFIERLIDCAARFGVPLVQRSFDSGTAAEMVKVETRRCGDIAKLSALWDLSGDEFSKGYLAGIFDAEGSFGKNGGSRPSSLRIANTNAQFLEAVVSHGKAVGFEFKVENFHGRHCKTARLYGSLDEIGRFLGQVRPALSYKKQAAFGCRIEGRNPRVVSVEYLGERDLVDIQTSKRTFVADGYLTHNCYAETFAERFRGTQGHPYERGFEPRVVPGVLEAPLRWRRPRRVFVNSMSDLFQDAVPTEFIARAGEVMRQAHWHVFQVLTKRHTRMSSLLSGDLRWMAELENVWFGVSVENRRYGIPRIEALRSTPATVRFLSIEPLLEDLGQIPLDGIGWVIVGGESGAGARTMRPEWVVSILSQCRAAGIPFFFKQWGGVRKKVAGRELLGRTFDELPPRPVASRG